VSAAVWAGVAVLGTGAVARVPPAGAVGRRTGRPHLGTLAVNPLAALVAGALAGLALDGADRALLAAGALGAFGTFSTWMAEARALAVAGRPAAAYGLIAVALAGGLGAAALG